LAADRPARRARTSASAAMRAVNAEYSGEMSTASTSAKWR
jgi:hypothetical protein